MANNGDQENDQNSQQDKEPKGTGSGVCTTCFQNITWPLSDPNNQSGHAGWCGGPKP